MKSTSMRPRFAVFTALDSTLHDPDTFEPGTNRDMLAKLKRARVPVIPMTVMTLPEVEPLARDLGFTYAMVIEAGGAIARWNGSAWDVDRCGSDTETLLEAVRDIEDRSGARLLVYSVLSEPEARRVSGRTGDMLRRSTIRNYSEPFVIEEGTIAAVREAAETIGFSVRRGQRFFYLCRACDEGQAFMRIRSEIECEMSISLGGSLIDADYLVRSDVPIIVPRRNGEPDPDLVAAVPNALIASAPAPDGWGAAVRAAMAAVPA